MELSPGCIPKVWMAAGIVITLLQKSSSVSWHMDPPSGTGCNATMFPTCCPTEMSQPTTGSSHSSSAGAAEENPSGKLKQDKLLCQGSSNSSISLGVLCSSSCAATAEAPSIPSGSTTRSPYPGTQKCVSYGCCSLAPEPWMSWFLNNSVLFRNVKYFSVSSFFFKQASHSAVPVSTLYVFL